MALISALLIMMVCTVVVTASLALAVHTNGQSADQRNLTAALHAADYGLQEELASLSGQPSATGATCTPIAGGLLPNTTLPAQWFTVTMPGCVVGSPNRTIIATGSAIGAGASPPATAPASAVARTVVAHVTLQPAGALSTGGYGFPDAILALKGAGANQTGAILAASGNPLTVSGTSGPQSIRADGPVTLTNGSLPLSLTGLSTGTVSSWDNITLTNNAVQGNVASAKTVTLNSSNVSGYVEGSTVNLGSPPSTVGTSRSGTVQLPTQPPVPNFTYIPAHWFTVTGAGSATTTCPATGGTLSGLYVLSSSCILSPASVSGVVAVIINTAGDLTVTLPSNAASGLSQLYLIATNGNVRLTDSGAAVPIFAYGSGTISTSGTIPGQLAGGNIVTVAPTTVISESITATPGGTPPDFAFPAAGGGPTPTGFVPQLSDEYLCAPNVTTAC